MKKYVITRREFLKVAAVFSAASALAACKGTTKTPTKEPPKEGEATPTAAQPTAAKPTDRTCRQ